MTRNIEMLVQVARGLGDLRPEVVFVGGAVVELFVTAPAATGRGSRKTSTSSWRSRPGRNGPGWVSDSGPAASGRIGEKVRRSAGGCSAT